ncbi:MAG TPA: excinuclease ABC subunit A, partial [Polyangiaceae bacterium]|nr:excinuclease ABC subunit A [Polyangiaceae bacterium]
MPSAIRAAPNELDPMHAIQLRGARTHHLKGVDLDLHPGELVVVAGVSGAGKSSLAFDTLYSEAQRRFVESFSPYARQFLERLERPPMQGLEPVAAGVAVDRRAPIKSSRSTVATMTDLEAYLSALFLREARPVCPDCDVLAEALSADAAAQTAIATHDGARALVSYALAVTGTEHYLDVREGLARDGYRRLFVNGEVRDLDGVRPSEAFGSVEVVVDRFNVSVRQRRRAASALEEAWRRSDGRASVHLWREDRHLTIPAVRGLSCPKCGREFSPPRSGLFSYQSPVGACASCRGFGRVLGIDYRKVVPDDSKSIAERAIRPWNGKKTSWERRVLRMFCEERGIPLDAPWRELSDAQREMVMEGEARWGKRRYPGVRTWFQWIETKSYKMHVRVFLSRYRSYDPCEDCGAKRLSKQALGYRL